MTTGSTSMHLLAPVRILDVAGEGAGFCTRLLADLGADVIRAFPVEENTPRLLPPFSESAFTDAGKYCVALNPNSENDRKAFLELAATADVLIETALPGKMEESGLGYGDLTRVNPRLIMVSVTGFGRTGPLSGTLANVLTISAAGGQMHASGTPESPPLKLFGSQPFLLGSLYAAVSILLALARRERTGCGCHIDISLQETVVSALEHVLPALLHGAPPPRRWGPANPRTGYCLLPCLDGPVLINLHRHWPVLAAWMAADGMAGDLIQERWEEEAVRRKNFFLLCERAGAWTERYLRRELVEQGQLMQLPWAVVQDADKILHCPQLSHRKFFHSIERSQNIGKPASCAGLPFLINGHRPALSKTDNGNRSGGWRAKVGNDPENARRTACPEQRDAPSGILHGIRILDFTRVLSGPLATRMLADFGAEVIKVQSRRTATGTEVDSHPYFKTYNRNKKSVTLDMGHPEARQIVLDLAARSDVVIENFSPRVMANWQLLYADFRQVQPSIIMASMSGMGQSGPWRNYAAYGQTVQAFGGLTALTAFSEQQPIGAGYAHADTVSALYAALAVLAALEHRRRTGLGTFIDLSQYEAACTLVGRELMEYSHSGRRPLPEGNVLQEKRFFVSGCYPCTGEDRWCVLAVTEEEKWHALCQLIQRPEWRGDDRLSSAAGRRDHRQMIEEGIAAWTCRHTPETAVGYLREIGIDSYTVNGAEDLLNDPQLRYRRYFHPIDPENPESPLVDACPIRMPGYKKKWHPAPTLGADNRSVFMGLLGMDEDRYGELRKMGVIS